MEDGTSDYQLVVQYDYRRLRRGCTYYLYVFTIIIPQRHTYISICTYIHLVVVVAVVGMYVVVVFHQQLLSTVAVVLVFLGLWFYFCYYYFFFFHPNLFCWLYVRPFIGFICMLINL